jgi:hypothetical protein
MIGFALVAAVFMSAVAVSSASAEHQWLVGGNPISSAIKVHSLGLLLLTDTKATGGEIKVHCKGLDDGTVGPGGLDLILAITTELLKGSDKIPCTFDKQGACNSSPAPTALALHLPWRTLIVLINGEVRDLLLGDGNGAPAWMVSCSTLLGEMTDTCEEEAGHMAAPLLANVAEGVKATFDETGSPPAKCSMGGAETGIVRGSIELLSPGTEALTFD